MMKTEDKKDYIVFNHNDFTKRVRACINIYGKEFGITNRLDIPIDVSNRMTRGLGVFRYRGNNPIKLVFSFRLLNGMYTTEFVDDVIKHEVAHYLIFMQGNRHQGHGSKFKNMCKIMNCNSKTSCTPEYSTKGIKEEVNRIIEYQNYPYAVECVKCGNIIRRKTLSKVIKYPHHYGCGGCNGELVRIK